MRVYSFRPFLLGFLSGLITLSSLNKIYPPRSRKCDPESRYTALQRPADSTNPSGNSGRILCWISTTKKFKKRALLVKKTWGKRCDILLFMSPNAVKELPAVVLPVPDGRPSLWGKTVEAWKHIYDNYLDQADWFYKADDDTYAVMDNMRDYLSKMNSSLPLYLGFAFRNNLIPAGFLSGGAGYVLTRETIKKFVEVGLNDKKPLCNMNVEGADDWNVGMCMRKLNVSAMDTRDPDGRLRFMPWKLDHLLTGSWSQRRLAQFKYPMGLNCCSTSAVSFHYVRDSQPLIFEYLIYGLQRPSNRIQ